METDQIQLDAIIHGIPGAEEILELPESVKCMPSSIDANVSILSEDAVSVKSANTSTSKASSATNAKLQDTLKNMSNKGSARKTAKGVTTTAQHEAQAKLVSALKAAAAQLKDGKVTRNTLTRSTARKSCPEPTPTPPKLRQARRTSQSSPTIDSPTVPEKTTPETGENSLNASGLPGSMKKKRRYYKGGTYGLYLSKRYKKKKNKENESREEITGEESNQSSLRVGTEDSGQSEGESGEEDIVKQVDNTEPIEIESPEQEKIIYETKSSNDAKKMDDVYESKTTQVKTPTKGFKPGPIGIKITRSRAAIIEQKPSEETTAIEPSQETSVVAALLTPSVIHEPEPTSKNNDKPNHSIDKPTGFNEESLDGMQSHISGSDTQPKPRRGRRKLTDEDQRLPSIGNTATIQMVNPLSKVPPIGRRSLTTNGNTNPSNVIATTNNIDPKPQKLVINSSPATQNHQNGLAQIKSSDAQQVLLRISTTGSVLSSTSLVNDIGILNGKNSVLNTRLIVSNESRNSAASKCLCTVKPVLSSTESSKGKPVFCQAIDCFDGKLIGCCNQARLLSLFRPSKRTPYKIICEVHLARLRRHHCCPGCGIFCTQGEFLECFAIKKQVHLFHKNCQIVHDLGPNKQHCIHCNNVTDLRCVRLEMNGPINNSVYHLSQTPVLKPSRAKITLTKLKDIPAIPDPSDEPGVEYTIPETKKTLSLAGLPIGPTRKQLETMLSGLTLDKQAIRFTNKNFYTVAKNGEIDKVLSLLAQGFDPNYTFEENDNETPLHAAASAGHLVIVHLLIQAGASVNVLNNKMATPLMQSIINKHASVIKFLLKAGAAVDIRGEDGMTALHLAAKHGNLDAVHHIIQFTKININLQDEGGWTSLVWATEHKHMNIVKYLLSKGADPSIQDDEENVGLHWAAFSGVVTIAYLFLEMCCEINSVNLHGDTPLHIASRRDNYDCVVLLLSRGADLTLLNKNNESPLMCCPKNSSSAMALKVNCELRRFTSSRQLQSDKYLHRDVSKGKEYYQIPIVNGMDNELVPLDYMYITDNCETSPINIDRTITSLQSCHCEDDCTTENCICAAISFRCWYDREGKLVPEFNIKDPPMIFECNRACSCWKSCYNRVVQFGVRQVRLQVFRTNQKGWGVRPLKDIPKGTFVCEYVGEIITDSEADRREDDSYLFDLDNRDGETYCLDARFYGNVSRFINHCCEPNLTPVKVFVDHQDLSFPRIALFANRPIKAFEELGFDYGEKFWVIKYRWFTCDCGTLSCKYSKENIHTTLESYYKRIREEQTMNSGHLVNGINLRKD